MGDNDPKNLHWDEDARNGFNKVMKLKTVDGVRVFYWNIAYGSLNGGKDIDANLKELIQSTARPDVIILTEAKRENLYPDTYDLLKTEYPGHVYMPYGGSLDEVGIDVWSTYPFSQTPPVMLDWSPMNASADAQKAFKDAWAAKAPKQYKWWDRPYSMLKWDLGGFKMNLVPLHLLEPWDEVRKDKGDFGTWANMMFSKDNPLYYSVERLIAKMKADLGGDIDSQPLLMIGDLNTPKSVFRMNTKVYNLLDDVLDDVFPGEPASFPAFSAPARQEPPFKYSMVKLDHAFHNEKVNWRGAAVLPLRGSDHYPIYVVVEPKK